MPKEIQTLDQVKASLLDKKENNVPIYQTEIDKILEVFDFSDEDSVAFLDWLNENVIIAEDEDLLIPEHIAETESADDISEFLGESDGEESDEEINIVDLQTYDAQYSIGPAVKINDPVKMYLKEIGRVSLISPADEPEIARRINKVLMLRKQ